MKKFVLTCGLVAGTASAFNLRRASRLRSAEEPGRAEPASAESQSAESPAEESRSSCGVLKLPPNAKAANYGEGKKETYSSKDKKMVPLLYYAGDTVELKCEQGFTLDGARDGPVKFETKCTEGGYYKPTAACNEASKCGALPQFDSAHPTGEVVKRVGMPDRFEYTCNTGYSLDGEKVVEGGLGKNQLFTVDCSPMGTFTEFKGKCQPYAFVASSKIIETYKAVFNVLWEVECKNKMTAHDELPVAMESICSKNFSDDPAAESECETLISEAKQDIIEKNKADKEEFKESDSLDSTQFKERDASAKKFCNALSELHWKAAPADGTDVPPTAL